MRADSSDTPSATDESAANTTSDSITSAVVWALRRAAPYCSARLEAKNVSPKPRAYGHHDRSGGKVVWPKPTHTTAKPSESAVPPANMAIMRAPDGVSWWRRSSALVQAKLAPPMRAR